jgi:hypothetical protein
VKSRTKPADDIEIGDRSSIPALFAKIAFSTGQKRKWDAAAERFIDSPDADKYLSREYRKPWALLGVLPEANP